jgi:uncharacterized protein YdaU (DUF1376 family)
MPTTTITLDNEGWNEILFILKDYYRLHPHEWVKKRIDTLEKEAEEWDDSQV